MPRDLDDSLGLGAEEVAQWCLPCNPEDLSSVPRAHVDSDCF